MQIHRLIILTFLLFIAAQAHAGGLGDCKANASVALAGLKNKKNDPEVRTAWGACLFRYHFANTEVAQTLTSIMRDPEEDVLLREDLIEALSETPLRKKIKVHLDPIASVGKEEQEALEKTGRGLNALISVTQGMKSMDEVVPTSKYEGDFIKALSEISLDEKAHVLLRLTALSALEKITQDTIASGIYDDRYLKVAQESLQTISLRDDPVAHYSGLQQNYEKLAALFPKNSGLTTEPARAISSQK